MIILFTYVKNDDLNVIWLNELKENCRSHAKKKLVSMNDNRMNDTRISEISVHPSLIHIVKNNRYSWPQSEKNNREN